MNTGARPVVPTPLQEPEVISAQRCGRQGKGARGGSKGPLRGYNVFQGSRRPPEPPCCCVLCALLEPDDGTAAAAVPVRFCCIHLHMHIYNVGDLATVNRVAAQNTLSVYLYAPRLRRRPAAAPCYSSSPP